VMSRFEIAFPEDAADITEKSFFKSLYLVVSNTSNVPKSYDIKIGEFSFYDDANWRKMSADFDLKNIPNYVTSFRVHQNWVKLFDLSKKSQSKSVNIELELGKLPPEAFALIKNIRVFKNNKWVLDAKSPHIFIENVELSAEQGQDEIKLQVILKNGNRANLQDIATLKIENVI